MMTVPDTHNIILIFYYLNQMYPGVEKNFALKKYYDHSHMREQQTLA
jgi:hypothetical protein